jgi:hypothetical protein
VTQPSSRSAIESAETDFTDLAAMHKLLKIACCRIDIPPHDTGSRCPASAASNFGAGRRNRERAFVTFLDSPS